MPRRWTLTAISALGALSVLTVVHLGRPGVASADELDRPLEISIDEAEGQTVVHIRDPGGELGEPKIATSHRGFMLSFTGEVVQKDALRTNGWRLGRVQTGQYGERAVVRLIQRQGRRGPIDDHAQVIAVDDGLDIVVVDRPAPPTPMIPDAGLGSAVDTGSPVEAVDDPATESGLPTTAETVAALQDQLGPAAAELSDETQTDAVDAVEVGDADADTDTDTDRGALSPGSPDAEVEAEAALDAGDAFDVDDAPPADAAAAGPFASSASEATTPSSFAAWTLIPSILGLAGLGLWMRRRKQTLAGTALEVVAKTSLGPKQQIVQVKVDGRELLLGVTEHQIGLITEVKGGLAASSTSVSSNPTARAAGTSTHHEFGVPAPVADRTDAAASNRIDAFKSRLSNALRSEVTNNDTGEDDAATAPSTRPADLGELRRLLDRRGEDPAWAREDVA